MAQLFMDGLKGASDAGVPTGIQGAFLSLGMGMPWQRFVGATIGTTGLLWMVKPRAMFGEDGTARPWSVLVPFVSGDGPTPTVAPFWLAGLFVGFLSATFI